MSLLCVPPQLYLYQSEDRPSSLLPYCDLNNFTLLKIFFLNGWMKDSTGIKKWHLFRESCIPSGFLLVPSQFLPLPHLYRETWRTNHFLRQRGSSHTLAPGDLGGFLVCLFLCFAFSINGFVRESYSELTHVDVVNADFFHLNIYLWCNFTKDYLCWDSLSKSTLCLLDTMTYLGASWHGPAENIPLFFMIKSWPFLLSAALLHTCVSL